MASSSDPANVGYIIQENGFWYVAYKEKVKVPEVVVSAKGVVNGLSEEYNDGWDFGPDSYDPTSTSAIPYTRTAGIQEAWNYAVSVGINYNITLSSILASINYFIPEIHLLSGAFIIKKGITFSAPFLIENFKLTGDTSMSPYIVVETSDGLFTFDANTFANTNIEIDNLQPVTGDGYTPEFIIKADFSSTNSGNNLFQSYNLDTGGEFQAGIILNSFLQANFYNYQTYCPAGDQLTTIGTINYFGGQLGGAAGLSGVTSHSYSGSIGNIAFYAVNNILPVTINTSSVVFISFYDSSIANITLDTTTCHISIYNCSNAPGQTSPLITATKFSVIDLLTIRGLVLSSSSSLVYLDNTSLLSVINIDIKGLYPTDTPLPVLTPSISTNPPVSGTVYQNTNAYAIEIDMPVYATTAATAGYVTVAKGATSTPTAIGNQFVSGSTSSTSTDIIKLRVPAGWYYEFTASGVTLGTATVFAD